ncbi:MAG: hypothetical protein E7218_08645 [Anaerofustis stercorihominis]|nr:hypothetical protein [Anaerofustis stercorihominis]
MKKITAIIMVLLFMFTAGCSEAKPVEYMSKDESYAITLTDEWENAEGLLNSGALFEFINKKEGIYFVVIPYPAELFPTLADFVVNIKESVPQWYPDCDVKEPTAYKYDELTYYKLYATQNNTEDGLAFKFNMSYDTNNYLLSISYTDNADDYTKRLEQTEAIVHSLVDQNPVVVDPSLNMNGENPNDPNMN